MKRNRQRKTRERKSHLQHVRVQTFCALVGLGVVIANASEIAAAFQRSYPGFTNAIASSVGYLERFNRRLSYGDIEPTDNIKARKLSYAGLDDSFVFNTVIVNSEPSITQNKDYLSKNNLVLAESKLAPVFFGISVMHAAVSISQYQDYLAESNLTDALCGDDRPMGLAVNCINATDAEAYCEWLGQKYNLPFAGLPTERIYAAAANEGMLDNTDPDWHEWTADNGCNDGRTGNRCPYRGTYGQKTSWLATDTSPNLGFRCQFQPSDNVNIVSQL